MARGAASVACAVRRTGVGLEHAGRNANASGRRRVTRAVGGGRHAERAPETRRKGPNTAESNGEADVRDRAESCAGALGLKGAKLRSGGPRHHQVVGFQARVEPIAIHASQDRGTMYPPLCGLPDRRRDRWGWARDDLEFSSECRASLAWNQIDGSPCACSFTSTSGGVTSQRSSAHTTAAAGRQVSLGHHSCRSSGARGFGVHPSQRGQRVRRRREEGGR